MHKFCRIHVDNIAGHCLKIFPVGVILIVERRIIICWKKVKNNTPLCLTDLGSWTLLFLNICYCIC